MKVLFILIGAIWSIPLAMAHTYSVKAQVYFERIESVIVSEIENAQRSVYVQIFKFNSRPIAQALVAAHQRGVKVEVMMDAKASTDKKSQAAFLSEAGVPMFVDAEHSTAHNKIMIVDSDRVITGSFNYTKKADRKNAENILLAIDSELRNRYFDNWSEHRKHCVLYSEFVQAKIVR